MSITALRPYFKTRCETVGLKQHMDVFNLDNIPSSVMDLSYHIGAPRIDGTKLNQNDQEISASIDISFFIKGARLVSDAIDKAISKSNDLIVEAQKPVNRIGVLIKNVSLSSVIYEPIDASNDNSVKCTVSFNCVLTIQL